MSNAEPIANCPDWGEWLDSRKVAVRCKGCYCVYTGRYVSEYGPKKGKMMGGVPKKCTVCARKKKEDARKALPIDTALVTAVKLHANENYNTDGWDYIVETFTDVELWEVIAGAKDAAAAIRKAHSVAKLLSERRSDIEGTAW